MMNIMMGYSHVPVLLDEALYHLNLKNGQTIIDATLGLGGHAEAILRKLGGKGKLIGIDRDGEALDSSKERLKSFGDRFIAVKDEFSDIKNILKNLHIEKVDGILFDLGVSSMQIDSPIRGFSLRQDGPLDMRMDKTGDISAEDIVNDSGREELEKIIRDFGEERLFKRIAKGLIIAREKQRIDTTFKLVDAIKRSIPRMNPKFEMDIMTRVFQAIRIKVNNELDRLKRALEDSIDLLNAGGRIVVISYHSLEDRIVKNVFKTASVDCICPPRQPKCTCQHEKKLAIITKKPITASTKEIGENPRSRSAKMRAAERT